MRRVYYDGQGYGVNPTPHIYNEEGTFYPTKSNWGQALALATPQLIEQPTPIGQRVDGYNPFGGSVGGMATRSANVQALFAPGGYWGDTPGTLQDVVAAPPPWERP